MSDKMPKFGSVDEYIAAAPSERQPALRQIREAILAAAPQAEEKIRYDMPGYYLGGKPLIYFSLQKKHIALHAGTQAVVALAGRLAGYTHTKGSIHLPLGEPVPGELIDEIVSYKMRSSNGPSA